MTTRPHRIVIRRNQQPLFNGEPFPFAIAQDPPMRVEWDGATIIKVHLTILCDVGATVTMEDPA